MRYSHFPMVCLLAVLPLGCANWNTFSTGQQAGSESGQLDQSTLMMATDFVNAVKQVNDLSPSDTTIQLLNSSAADPFTLAMQSALKNAGYGIRWVDDGVNQYLMQYRHVREASSGASHRDIYEVAVGKVEMRRTYVRDESGKVKPVTPLYVRGTDASNIVLNDSAFEPSLTSNNRTPTEALVVATPVPEAAKAVRQNTSELASNNPQRTSSTASQSRLALPSDANPLSGLIPNSINANILTLPLTTLPRLENVFELGTSNYEDLLVGHETVEERVLTFPNDSVRLGNLNKRYVQSMVERFDPSSDIFSLLGCSVGPTSLEAGNAALALGRSSRVREALLFAGVPQDKILDEGCWAGDSTGFTSPRRAVVVTLNRRP